MEINGFSIKDVIFLSRGVFGRLTEHGKQIGFILYEEAGLAFVSFLPTPDVDRYLTYFTFDRFLDLVELRVLYALFRTLKQGLNIAGLRFDNGSTGHVIAKADNASAMLEIAQDILARKQGQQPKIVDIRLFCCEKDFHIKTRLWNRDRQKQRVDILQSGNTICFKTNAAEVLYDDE